MKESYKIKNSETAYFDKVDVKAMHALFAIQTKKNVR